MSALPVTDVRNYLTGLQSRIVGALEDAEGAAFRSDSWTRAEGGGGLSRLLEGGALFERAGVLFSHVKGSQLPPSASAHRPEAGRPPLGSHGRVHGAASAQPLCADHAHERAHVPGRGSSRP